MTAVMLPQRSHCALRRRLARATPDRAKVRSAWYGGRIKSAIRYCVYAIEIEFLEHPLGIFIRTYMKPNSDIIVIAIILIGARKNDAKDEANPTSQYSLSSKRIRRL